MNRFSTLVALALVVACGQFHYAGPLHPAAEQAAGVTIADDGTVTYTQGRLSVWMSPMTDEELNRLYPDTSPEDSRSTNPFTYANRKSWATGQQMKRFTVFRLGVKNYEYPKVRIDPASITLRASNGREYASLSYQELDTYFRKYAIGYRGNAYLDYQEKRDLLRRTLFTSEDIFSGQEQDRYVVFPLLHADVRDAEVIVHDVALRFDFRGEPVETVDLSFFFEREIGKQYKDGRIVLEK